MKTFLLLVTLSQSQLLYKNIHKECFIANRNNSACHKVAAVTVTCINLLDKVGELNYYPKNMAEIWRQGALKSSPMSVYMNCLDTEFKRRGMK